MEGANGAQCGARGLITLSGVLGVCALELVVLDGNLPAARVHSAVREGLRACTISTAFAMRGRFVLPPEWCLLGCIHHTDEATSWCHGAPLADGSLLTLMPGAASEFVLSAGTALSVLVLPFARVQEKLDPAQLRELGSPALTLSHLHLPPEHALRDAYQALQQGITAHSAAMNVAAAHLPVDPLLDQHVRALAAAGDFDRAVSGRGRHTHYRILRRAEDFMRRNLRHNLYMKDICEAAEVSERALRYAFDDLLGVSPNRYLALLRLCAACRALSAADATRNSVKAIALGYGLWDLSRFAESYRRTFGELPRDTLLRACTQQP
ncbi:MAG TPA: AraC family transcriptional regulator [Stenotrophomonas sp.]|nr:AraC family transcriptional regulator [Stenotrophomonas sp.]